MEIAATICLTIVIVSAMVFKVKFSYKGIKLDPTGGTLKSAKESAKIAFQDVYSDIDEETKDIEMKIRSLCKSTFIKVFKKENNLSYNETLNHIELKRYVSLLKRSASEVIRPGLRKKVFRNSFPDQSKPEEFQKTCDHKTKSVADSSRDFITAEWTLDFSRGVHLNEVTCDEYNQELFKMIRGYYIRCIRIKENAAKALEMQYAKQGFDAEHFKDEFKCFYDALPNR